jgi:outer membrane lipoprotein-sorting protein
VDRLHHRGPVASRLALLIVVLLSATPPAFGGTATAGPSLEDVMRLLAASGGVRASYHEQKHISLLSEPLESEGKLFFQPPDRLARHVEKPGRAWLAVRNDQVVMRDATGEERLDLGRSDVARALVDSLAVVLRGDLGVLNARYEVAFRALEAGWRIDLMPRSRMLKSLIASMAIDGVGSEIRRVEVREESGDWAITEFSAIQTGVRFTPEESGEIFLLTPSPLATHD